MPGQRQRVLWANRENILSSDLTRIGKITNMELQQLDELRSMRADFYLPASNAFDDFGSAVKDAAYTAIEGLTRPPSIDPIAGTFNVTLGAGEGEVLGAGTIPADESEYQLVRFVEQVVAWPLAGQPNPSNPRICLIIATPADVSAEPQSRQILVNPDTRETSPATVYKLSQPQAGITVLPGDAAADPAPPACPAGSLPLFEVVVPAGAADSTEYHFVRRAWRRIEFPGTSQHGILEGCKMTMQGTSAPLLSGGGNRIVIDGELLTFFGSESLAVGADTLHTPGSAPAGNDMATYLYMCGGRHDPMRSQTVQPGPGGQAGNYVPVVLLESTTTPDSRGYPSASLAVGGVTIPRAACCYIGLKFRAAGSTGNRAGHHDGDWFRFVAPCGTPLYFKRFGAVEPTYTSTGAVTLGSLPAISDAAELVGAVSVSGNATFSANGEIWGSVWANADRTDYTGNTVVGGTALQNLACTVGAGTAIVIPTAYKMHVPRLQR